MNDDPTRGSPATPGHSPPQEARLDLSSQRTAALAAHYRDRLASLPELSDATTVAEATAITAERAGLLTALVLTLAESSPGEAAQCVAELERMAALGNPAFLHVHLLMARFALDLSPGSLSARVDMATKALGMLEADEGSPLRETLLPAAFFMFVGSLMESGDMRAVDEAISAEVHCGTVLEPVVRSRYAVWFRCARACMDGHIPLAESLAEEGYELAVAAHDIDADAVRIGQLAVIRWMQGRVSEMEREFLQVRQADPRELIWAAAVAWIWSRQGRVSAARGLVESLPDPGSAPRGRNWLAAIAILAEAVVEVGSDDIVERIRQLLEPYADRIVPVGLGVVCWGTVARPLALLAVRQGRIADAIARYRDAISVCSRVGAQAWLSQAQIELAALLLSQGKDAEARQLTTESLAAARQLGLRVVEQRAERVVALLDGGPAFGPLTTTPVWAGNSAMRALRGLAPAYSARPSDGYDDAPEANVGTGVSRPRRPKVAVLGEFSVVGTDGEVATWKSRKARTLLKMLLARRGTAFARESAIQLLWPDEAFSVAPSKLRNRLAVAITTIRKALDPLQMFPAEEFVESTKEVLRLRMDHLTIDVEEFFATAKAAREAEQSDQRESLLRKAFEAYRGEALAEEPYEAWAEQLRRQAHLTYFTVAHALAEIMTERGEHFDRVDLYQSILRLDPYDQVAYDGLAHALDALGAAQRAEDVRRERRRIMMELGLADPSAAMK